MFHTHIVPVFFFKPFGGFVGLIGLIFWILMLVDSARRRFSSGAVNIAWFLVVFCGNVCGAAIYFFFGRPMGRLDS